MPLTQTGAAGGLAVKSTGTFVATGTSAVTVSDTKVASGDAILISLNTPGGTVGAIPAVKTVTNGTGFTVSGTASDTSTYNYAVVNFVSAD